MDVNCFFGHVENDDCVHINLWDKHIKCEYGELGRLIKYGLLIRLIIYNKLVSSTIFPICLR